MCKAAQQTISPATVDAAHSGVVQHGPLGTVSGSGGPSQLVNESEEHGFQAYRTHLFNNITTWTTKEYRGVYEQVSQIPL